MVHGLAVYRQSIFPLDLCHGQPHKSGDRVVLCIAIFTGAYYSNIWNAQSSPFLSQVLFSEASNIMNPVQWNQTAMIGPDNIIDKAALVSEGLPWFATSYAISCLVANMAVTAAITHLYLYFWPEMKGVYAFLSARSLKRLLRLRTWNLKFWESGRVPDENQDHYDPH
ncbi:MAG: hypothetical protein FRX48_02446 [Lasallia pustulata]|uniref:Uncharacterized protein n=1 Tax=Lasallia pustulata TaxID=136370 RepID=A0A5M8PYE3_9LECA|nr:MAG: hypothetical protein FRX48_02446 [Lasallia pustulata]